MKYTEEECKKEVKKYTHKIDFRRENKLMYLAIKSRFPYMLEGLKNSPAKKYSKEEIIAVSSKIIMLSDFYKKHTSMYLRARKDGYLKEITKHMVKSYHFEKKDTKNDKYKIYGWKE